MKSNYILAVDGGATKTTISLRSLSGEIIFETTSSGSNYQTIGELEVQQILTALLLQVAAHTTQLQVALFAIAGIDTPKDLQIVQRIVATSISDAAIQVEQLLVENDVEATLLGATNGQPGALAISGTGAIALVYNGEQILRAGGWGHRVGDEGSGYWIGQQIARAIFRTEDGLLADQTLLTTLVYKKLGITSLDALADWLYADDYTNARMANISSVLAEALAEGDQIAQVIASEAAYELTLIAKAALQKLNYANEPLPFYLNGGVLLNNEVILLELIDRLSNNYPHLQFVVCEEQPIEYIVKRAIAALQIQL